MTAHAGPGHALCPVPGRGSERSCRLVPSALMSCGPLPASSALEKVGLWDVLTSFLVP